MAKTQAQIEAERRFASLTSDQQQQAKTGKSTAQILYPEAYKTEKKTNNYSGGVRAFTPSADYYQELTHANNILNVLKSGQTAYTDQLNNIMNQIQNRGKFSYDMDTDSLFQNSLQSAMRTGKAAMQDTMGQAAALTGGYGSTYATSAANQAYNAYIQDAYNNLPDYYNMALEAYNQETQNMYNTASMLQSADESWYNRIVNAYQAQADKVNQMYSNEYNNYWQAAQMNQSAAQQSANLKYQKERDAIADEKWLAEYEQSLNKASGSSTTPTYKASDFSKDIIAAVTSKGYGTQGWSDYATQLSNAYGIPLEQIDAIGQANAPQATYSLGPNNAYYDQWGRQTQGTSNFYLSEDKSGKNNDVYVDNYGNTYTYAELKSRGLLGQIKTK